MRSKRVYLIDNNIAVLGVKALVAGMFKQDATVCGKTTSYKEAYDAIGKMALPDLVLADINLGEGISLEGIKNLISLYPKLKILIFSAEKESLYAIRCLQAGAIGFISKNLPYEEIGKQIRKALEGAKSVISQEIAVVLGEKLIGRKHVDLTRPPEERLSDRELEIYTMIGNGLSTRQIALKLGLSMKTIETHRFHIKDKFGFNSTNEMVHHAISFNITKG